LNLKLRVNGHKRTVQARRSVKCVAVFQPSRELNTSAGH